MPYENIKKIICIVLFLLSIVGIIFLLTSIGLKMSLKEFLLEFRLLEENLSQWENSIKLSLLIVAFLGVAIALLTPFIQKYIEREDKKRTDLRLICYAENVQEYYHASPVKNISDNAVGVRHGTGFWYKLKYFRIAIKNKGEVTARDVEVSLESIEKRKNFIPIPLNWTHINSIKRNISPGQTVYFDVFCTKENDNDNPIITSPIGFHGKKMSQLSLGHNKLIIKLYQDNGKTRTIDLKINIGKDGEDGFPLCDLNDFYEK